MLNKYFDNACTSFPKPLQVGEQMLQHVHQGGSYGRAAYKRIFFSTQIVEEARDLVSNLLGVSNSANVIFDLNATHAINQLLNGFNFKHRKVLVSPLEHNAVMRPLHSLGIHFELLPSGPDGLVRVELISSELLKGVDLVILNHVSNVNGVIQPVAQIKDSIGEIPILIDASQSLGKVDLLIDEWGIDYVAFTGHKGLLGPTGTGGFYAKYPNTIRTTITGGTGSNSEGFEMPEFTPDRFQAGTPNITGIYGLLAALKYKPKQGWDREVLLSCIQTLQQVDSLGVICANEFYNQSDVFSIYPRNSEVSELASILYEHYGIETRSGLHCSPLAHKTLGTFPKGTVRFSLSPYHTNEDISYLQASVLNAIREV